MTPDHAQIVETTLQLAYTQTMTWNTRMAIPFGKNPPPYTTEMMWNSPLGLDLSALVMYVEGYQPQEDITVVVARLARTLFRETLGQSDRLPRDFHHTPLGALMHEAFARYFPKDAWMKTSEVVTLFGVKRQTVYDWVEQGVLAAYYVKGTQMFLRKDITRYYERWSRKKQHKALGVQHLAGDES